MKSRSFEKVSLREASSRFCWLNPVLLLLPSTCFWRNPGNWAEWAAQVYPVPNIVMERRTVVPEVNWLKLEEAQYAYNLQHEVRIECTTSLNTQTCLRWYLSQSNGSARLGLVWNSARHLSGNDESWWTDLQQYTVIVVVYSVIDQIASNRFENWFGWLWICKVRNSADRNNSSYIDVCFIQSWES